MSQATISLSPHLEKALSSRHPWIYRNHLSHKQLQKLNRLRAGNWLRVEAGSSHAWGLYDSDSPIAIRLYSWQKELPDSDFFSERVKEALQARASLHQSEATNAYRLINGENDFIPSLVADRYDRFVVLSSYSEGIHSYIPSIVKSLVKHSPFRIKGVVQKYQDDLVSHYGELPSPEITIRENGIQLLVNFYAGQKTGLFLDHRDNRLHMQRYCHDKKVLNLFSYSGAFSLYALQAGASHVTSVDSASAALADAERNIALNNIPPERHTAIRADCYAVLQEYEQKGKLFDIIILDPPSLAKAKSSRHSAARAYRKLNKAALACVKTNGLLISASCTAQISAEHFKEILGEAANEANKRLQIIHEAGQAPDHLLRAGFMEGRYLKFVVARVLD